MTHRLGSWLVAAGLGLALLASACGAPREDTAGAQPASEAAPAADGAPATPEDPLRVLMAGDSLMAEVAAALGPALHDGGDSVARFIAAPSIPRNDLGRLWLADRVRRFDPDVVVVLIGVWESMVIEGRSTHPVGSTRWERGYRDELLQPYVRLLTRYGAEVVWIGMPPMQAARRQHAVSAMNRALRHAALRERRMTYVPGDRLVATPSGNWTAFLPGPGGGVRRVRRVDTTHLCPEGVVRLARPVLESLRSERHVRLAANWPNGRWRWVFPSNECPPASGSNR